MSGQVIRLICPNLTCRTILSVPATARGKDVRCRACGCKVRIPMPKPVVAPVVEDGPEDGKSDGKENPKPNAA